MIAEQKSIEVISSKCIKSIALMKMIVPKLSFTIALFKITKLHYMNSMKLVILLHSLLYWSIHTKDESKLEITFALGIDSGVVVSSIVWNLFS